MSTRVEQGNTTNYTYDANHKHAVAQAGSNYFCYDNNGNMTKRNATSSGCASGGDTMTYDVENRMTSMVTASNTTNFAEYRGHNHCRKFLKSIVEYEKTEEKNHMPHPLVTQLRFTRSEFQRALQGLSEEDARQRFLPMNCISWNVGHLAWQEQRYFLTFAQDKVLLPKIQDEFRYGAPASTPSLAEMQDAWQTITRAADEWLDAVTTETLLQLFKHPAGGWETSFGNLLQRVIYHYWYHTGENMAIRQMLKNKDLPEFVGDIDTEAPYRAA